MSKGTLVEIDDQRQSLCGYSCLKFADMATKAGWVDPNIQLTTAGERGLEKRFGIMGLAYNLNVMVESGKRTYVPVFVWVGSGFVPPPKHPYLLTFDLWVEDLREGVTSQNKISYRLIGTPITLNEMTITAGFVAFNAFYACKYEMPAVVASLGKRQGAKETVKIPFPRLTFK